jgi:steroid delta-isomerase-like uncharacterized protein
MNQDQAAPVLRFYEEWNAGAIDFDALVADDIVNYQPGAEPDVGKQAFVSAVSGVMAAVPDSSWDVSDVLVDGDRVAVRITWSGTFQGDRFRGVPVRSAAAFAVEHIHIYRVAEGKLAEHWVVRDDLGMLQQLQAI